MNGIICFSCPAVNDGFVSVRSRFHRHPCADRTLMRLSDLSADRANGCKEKMCEI